MHYQQSCSGRPFSLLPHVLCEGFTTLLHHASQMVRNNNTLPIASPPCCRSIEMSSILDGRFTISHAVHDNLDLRPRCLALARPTNQGLIPSVPSRTRDSRPREGLSPYLHSFHPGRRSHLTMATRSKSTGPTRATKTVSMPAAGSLVTVSFGTISGQVAGWLAAAGVASRPSPSVAASQRSWLQSTSLSSKVST